MNCCFEYRKELNEINSDLRNLRDSVSSEINLEKVRYDIVQLMLGLLKWRNGLIDNKITIENLLTLIFGDLLTDAIFDKNTRILHFYNNKGEEVFNVTIDDKYIESIESDDNTIIFKYNDETEAFRILIPSYAITDFNFNNNTNTLTITLDTTGSHEVDLSSIVLQIPIIPGYYYSNSKYNLSSIPSVDFSINQPIFGDKYNGNNVTIEYIGTDLIKHPDNNQDHMYILEVKDRTTYRLAEKYRIPEPNSIYFVSSDYHTIIDYDDEDNIISYPTGKMAYFVRTVIDDEPYWYLKEFDILDWKKLGLITDNNIRTVGVNTYCALQEDQNHPNTHIEAKPNYCIDIADSFPEDYRKAIYKLYTAITDAINQNGLYVTVNDPTTSEEQDNIEFLNIFNEGTDNRLSNLCIIKGNPDSWNNIYSLKNFSDKYSHLWYISENDLEACVIESNNPDYTDEEDISLITFLNTVHQTPIFNNSYNVGNYIRFETLFRDVLPIDERLYAYKRSFEDSKYENLKWTEDSAKKSWAKSQLIPNYPNSNLSIFSKSSWQDPDIIKVIWRYLLTAFYSSKVGPDNNDKNPILNQYKEDIGWIEGYLDWKFIARASNIEFTQSQSNIRFDNSTNNFYSLIHIDFDFQYNLTRIYGDIDIKVKDFGIKSGTDTYALFFNLSGVKNPVSKGHHRLMPDIEITKFSGIFSEVVNDNIVNTKLVYSNEN